MVKFKGTQGKWTLDIIPESNGFAYINGGDITVYGELTKTKGTVSEECLSNAKLIAAAPEMLEMLIRISKARRYTMSLAEINVLIKKATE